MANKLPLKTAVPEILFITSYPPRECGIATYSQDLICSLHNKFSNSFKIRVCALESENEQHDYAGETKYILNVDQPDAFKLLSEKVNADAAVSIVMIQHEFGFFEKKHEDLVQLMESLSVPAIIAFHTVLPNPDDVLKSRVQDLSAKAELITVMTRSSADILIKEYGIQKQKINVIAHGTHLVPHIDKQILKAKYNLEGKKVLSTFGLLSSGKSIETTLDALPAVLPDNPDVLFLIIGKTHPSVLKKEGEQYRKMLETKVADLNLQDHVRFINSFLPLPELLEYLQLTDIYLFTSKDPNQAVSGTFSYAISSGCPIISTPIPHAREVLKDDTGIIFDFCDSSALGNAIRSLLEDETARRNISSRGLHRMASTAWENAAIAHAMLFEKIGSGESLKYNLPEINLHHFRKMTTEFGMIQFSKINHPDIESGFTLDDNARALVAVCRHFELTGDQEDLAYINTYLNFIKFCQQPAGNFLNYVDEAKTFTPQNGTTDLEDSNGRAIWALGFLLSLEDLFPSKLTAFANEVMNKALHNIDRIHSTRAMAFVIKGLHYRYISYQSKQDVILIRQFADRLVEMYKHESNNEWFWFEGYLTYANSVLPEAMLCAWIVTGEQRYKDIAKASFDFLIGKIFIADKIKVIPNKSWLYKKDPLALTGGGGEQPIDVAYTILALEKFHAAFKNEDYKTYIATAFNWFLGSNHLHQVIYNPCTGGCYDGLEEKYVNLNQGAESTVSYLMARLIVGPLYEVQLIAATAAKNKRNYIKPITKSTLRPV